MYYDYSIFAWSVSSIFGKPISDLIPEYGASATLGINQAIYDGGKIKLGIEAAQKDIINIQSI